MEPVSFTIQPAALANLLHNVVTISKEKPKEDPLPLVYLRYQYDDETGTGQLMGIGSGRHTAGLDWLEIPGGPDAYAEVRVTGVAAVKTDIVDDLVKLGSRIRGTSMSKSAAVEVIMRHKESISAMYGREFLGELADGDPDDTTAGQPGKPGIFERIEDLVDELTANPAPAGPVAFTTDLVARCKDIKVTGLPATWGIVDLSADRKRNLVAVAIGPTFRGLLGGIDRGKYAAGGPWHDGPGRPEHLLTGGGRRPINRSEGIVAA